MSDSDNTPFGFGRFVPGFDFLQSLAKGASSSAATVPGLASWVAPTVSVEELDKRISELKSVQFWLEQNSRALAATVQALEVQKMTLATLKNMNVAMGDLAGAFGSKMAAEPAKKSKPAAPAPEAPAQTQAHEAQAASASASQSATKEDAAQASAGAGAMVDAMQWWGALSNQFQQIASNAMRDVAQQASSVEASRDAATDAFKAASDMASNLAAQGVKGAQEMTRNAMDAATKVAPARKSAAKAAPAPAAKKAAAKKAPATRSSSKPKTSR